LLSFGTRASTADWLRTEQLPALRDAGRTEHVSSWMTVGQVQVDDEFMGCVDPRGWSGARLLGHLLKYIHPSADHSFSRRRLNILVNSSVDT
jgi:hypothetical protein